MLSLKMYFQILDNCVYYKSNIIFGNRLYKFYKIFEINKYPIKLIGILYEFR